MMIVDHYCTTAEKHRTAHGKLAVEKRNQCKKIIEDLEVQLKKMHLIEGEYGWIAKQPATIEKIAQESKDDVALLVAALIEYRERWPQVAQECLSDKTSVQPYMDARQKAINTQDPIAVAMRKRCEEYVVRAKELVKISQQRKNDGKVDIEEFNSDVSQIQTKMQDGKRDIDNLILKRNTQIAWFADMDKKKTWTADEKKLVDGQMTHLATVAKEARGSLKTLRLQLEGLERRGKVAGPGWREAALKAVKDAKDAYDAAEASSKSLDKHEKLGEAVMKKMAKS